MFGFFFLVGGVLEGFLRPDRETLLPRKTLAIGVVSALVVSVVAKLFGSDPIGFGGVLEVFLSAVSLTAFFLLGTWFTRLVRWGRDARAQKKETRTQSAS